MSTLLDHIKESVLIDKTNGNILYAPYFPMTAIYKNAEDYKQLLDEHTKAELYIMENGVSQKEYEAFEDWKKELNPEDLKYYNYICQYRQICLFDFYEELKAEWKRTKHWRSLALDQFLVLKKTTFSNVDYNEWNW